MEIILVFRLAELNLFFGLLESAIWNIQVKLTTQILHSDILNDSGKIFQSYRNHFSILNRIAVQRNDVKLSKFLYICLKIDK